MSAVPLEHYRQLPCSRTAPNRERHPYFDRVSSWRGEHYQTFAEEWKGHCPPPDADSELVVAFSGVDGGLQFVLMVLCLWAAFTATYCHWSALIAADRAGLEREAATDGVMLDTRGHEGRDGSAAAGSPP